MALTTPNQLPAPVQQTFAMRLLAVKQPALIHRLAAMKDRMPAHGGRIKRYRRYNKLATAPVPLGPSGITPPGQTLSAVDIDAQMDWYGKA